jgi:flavin reductase (DIM6/NTAB) family NADH-FMN oxidoreductase RutF
MDATGPASTPTAASSLDPRTLRRCFGRFTTGVTVVSYHVGEQVRGATVNSFTSVSLDPPLVLVSLSRTTQACAAMAGLPFAINVLRADQMAVALQFAGRSQPGLRIAWDTSADDAEAPSLADAVAVFQCTPWERYDGGDHLLQLGKVRRTDLRQGDPLVFSDGRFMTSGLPMLDGPLVQSLDGPPAPGWVGAAHRFHARAEG